MMARLRALFRRYASMNMRMSQPAQPIRDCTRQVIGFVDRIEVAQGHLHVEGWVQADNVTLLLAGQTDMTVPTLRREDVAETLGIPAQVGFRLSLPCFHDTLIRSAPPGLSVGWEDAGTTLDISLPFDRMSLSKMRLRIAAAFLRDGLKALPATIGWMLTRDYRYRAAVKRAFRLDVARPTGRLNPDIFAKTGAPAVPRPTKTVTIVLPVYNAFTLLPDVLDRVVRNTDLAWHLILIEDASSDSRVRPFLREFATRHSHVELVENDRNLGFIGSVNAGLDLALARTGPEDDGPVILLNSDALVPADWASRLVAPLIADGDVASTTPMTSDGEIVSVPVICQATTLKPGQVDAIDACARRLNPDATQPEMPTGVGFCMAISRDWLKRIPNFDTAFGRGYGEEVDWCQKIRRLGGRHLAVAGLFVEHVGGTSFGSEEKAERIASHNAIIASRYPDYDAEVQAFLANDPLRNARLALGLAWAGSRSDDPVPIYLAHSMGGGAENYLEARIADDLERGVTSVVLRVGGKRRWRIELVTPTGQITGTTNSAALVRQFLKPVAKRHIVYSCGVGDSDPVQLPAFLRTLKRSDDDRIDVLFHDYFPVSPSYTLLESDGVYRCPPVPGKTSDRAHVFRRPNGTEVTLKEWQKAWYDLIAEADELQVFSNDSAAQVAKVWPDRRDRIRVRSHRLLADIPRIDPPANPSRSTVGVLGNIGYQKGAALLQKLAVILGAHDNVGLVLIGNIDPHYSLPPFVPVLGSYKPKNIATLARKHGVTHWLVPSIWPETFSYTTREALATGLPVLAFDIGAQGEAVGAAANGYPMPFDPDGDWAATVAKAINDLTGGE